MLLPQEVPTLVEPIVMLRHKEAREIGRDQRKLGIGKRRGAISWPWSLARGVHSSRHGCNFFGQIKPRTSFSPSGLRKDFSPCRKNNSGSPNEGQVAEKGRAMFFFGPGRLSFYGTNSPWCRPTRLPAADMVALQKLCRPLLRLRGHRDRPRLAWTFRKPTRERTNDKLAGGERPMSESGTNLPTFAMQ